MPVSVRAALAAIPDPYGARAVDSAANLAGNELPFAPPASVVRAASEAAAGLNRYPQPAGDDLISAVARLHRVDPLKLAVGAGSASLLLHIIEAVCEPGNEVLYAWPGFEAYPHLASIRGATQVPVSLYDDQPELDAMSASVNRHSTRVVIVTNPHNPTGSAITRDQLEDFLDTIPENVLVVLDEAYREFVDDPDVADGMTFDPGGDWHNLAVLRTMSKGYGLGGARVGYLVAAPHIAAAVRKCSVRFPVNSIGQAAALAALDATDELALRWDTVRRRRDALRTELRDLGYAVPPSHANFVWLALGDNASSFAQHCLDHKLLVRVFPGNGVRVTIGRSADNRAFLAAARSFPGRQSHPSKGRSR
jgi:histidinol-phosphate aminotransferase